jgi:hypothetical protein
LKILFFNFSAQTKSKGVDKDFFETGYQWRLLEGHVVNPMKEILYRLTSSELSELLEKKDIHNFYNLVFYTFALPPPPPSKKEVRTIRYARDTTSISNIIFQFELGFRFSNNPVKIRELVHHIKKLGDQYREQEILKKNLLNSEKKMREAQKQREEIQNRMISLDASMQSDSTSSSSTPTTSAPTTPKSTSATPAKTSKTTTIEEKDEESILLEALESS